MRRMLEPLKAKSTSALRVSRREVLEGSAGSALSAIAVGCSGAFIGPATARAADAVPGSDSQRQMAAFRIRQAAAAALIWAASLLVGGARTAKDGSQQFQREKRTCAAGALAYQSRSGCRFTTRGSIPVTRDHAPTRACARGHLTRTVTNHRSRTFIGGNWHPLGQ